MWEDKVFVGLSSLSSTTEQRGYLAIVRVALIERAKKKVYTSTDVLFSTENYLYHTGIIFFFLLWHIYPPITRKAINAL